MTVDPRLAVEILKQDRDEDPTDEWRDVLNLAVLAIEAIEAERAYSLCSCQGPIVCEHSKDVTSTRRAYLAAAHPEGKT